MGCFWQRASRTFVLGSACRHLRQQLSRVHLAVESWLVSVSLKTSSPMRTRGAGGIAGLGRDRPISGELGRQEPSCLALPSSAAVSRCCCLAKAVATNRAFTWKGRGVKLSSPSAARVPSPPLCLADVRCGHLLSRLRLLLRGVGRAAPLRGQLAAPGQHPGGHLPAALPAGGGAR